MINLLILKNNFRGTPKQKFDYEQIKQKALHQFRSGKSLYGKDGVFGPMLKEFLKEALKGELDGHLEEEGLVKKNRKNGTGSKHVKTREGTMEISTPRDRLSTFEPEIIKKREVSWLTAWKARYWAYTAWG